MARITVRPKTRRGAVLAIAGGLGAAAMVGFCVIYFVFLPTSSDKAAMEFDLRLQRA